MKKAFATALFALVVALAVPQAAWAASVTPDRSWYDASQPSYSITTPNQWAGLVDIVNEGADDFSGKAITIGTLNFNGNSVKPAGSVDHPFRGIITGGTFRDIRIDTSGSTQDVGIIGYAKGPISNVTVSSVVPTIEINEAKGGRLVENVGIVVGRSEASVSNCRVQAPISITSAVEQKANSAADVYDGYNFLVKNVGGVAGIVSGAGNNVTGCANEGAITIKQTSTPVTDNEQNALVANVGGVVGALGPVDYSLTLAPGQEQTAAPDEYDMAHGEIANCSNAGRISLDTPSEAGLDRFNQKAYAQSTNIGGIAGYSRGNVTNCANSAFLNAPRGSGVGGIVGSLRALTTSSSYSGNFSSTGSDDGMKYSEEITVNTCTNWGDILGFVFPAGIVGRAGTYTTVTDCLSGITAEGAIPYSGNGSYIIAERWNKPFPAGIVGSTYGTVSYCANFASVASGSGYARSGDSAATFKTQSGYYASGLVGNTSRFTNADLTPKSPQPEIYACYNAGSIIANASMRQRALVGDNGGFVHDNVALEGCVSTNDLIYGDDPDESEASGGSSARNRFVTAAQLRGTDFIDADAGSTVCSLLNYYVAADNWQKNWVRNPSNDANSGYPLLKRQYSGSPTSLANATVAWKADAEYSGAEAVPRATVTLANGTKLEQDVDFLVKPQSGATAVSVYDTDPRPYTGTVEGMGTFTGTAAQAFKYGIDRGDMANCTISQVTTRQYKAAAYDVAPEDFAVITTAGVEVPVADYTVAINAADENTAKNLTDGKPVNAKQYRLTIAAADGSHLFYGTNGTGLFTIKTAPIIQSKDTTGNYAVPDKVKFHGAAADDATAIDWYSMTMHQNATDAELRAAGAVFPYTGHPVKPAVTGVTFQGQTVSGTIPLTEGTDYRVVYGATSTDSGTTSVDNVGKQGEISYGYIMVRYVAGSNFSNYEIMKFLIDGTNTAKLSLADAQLVCPSQIIYEPENTGYRPVELWYGGSQLTEGTDYDIAYQDNAAVGTASYAITGKGLYEGALAGTFDIVNGVAVTFDYAYNADGTAAVTGLAYHGALSAFRLAIPSTTTHDGRTYTVTAIADKAFGSSSASELSDDCKKIGMVEIPASIESIGDWAFCTSNINDSSGKSKITSITFAEGSNLKSIGASAFRKAAITTLTIPASVQSIGQRAFRDCTDLKTVTFESTSADAPAMHAQAFQNVADVTATYDRSATAVATYVTQTIRAQRWISNVPNAKPTTTTWIRLAGENAYGTMVKIVDTGFSAGSCDSVVLATFDGYWDALTASGLAGFYNCPVLLTDPDALSSETRDEIARLGATHAFIAGGTAAISSGVEGQVRDMGLSVTRVAGDNAAGTAIDAYRKGAQAGTWSSTAIVATSDGYWDALAASPLSYAQHMPIFLANVGTGYGTRLDEATCAAIREGGFSQVIICGGPAAVSGEVEGQLSGIGATRLQGDTAVETSKAIADFCLTAGMQADGIGVATTEGYWDALTGAALCGSNNAPLVLARPTEPAQSSEGTIAQNKDDIGTAYIFGGTAAIPDDVMSWLESATRTHSNSTSLMAAALP